ncbi:MFS transporter [Sulfobacillus harzensis]|uniref:MFS transporter n=1 Tax=Sulfobacillus harzensis TaxID=2729629 RepID=A0A7Y0L647_9FIRM|nr:MFS transporter [Sulfobacillus harzensis]NMP23441.1 MFS transporter [Sulfobacillus harzensis]
MHRVSGLRSVWLLAIGGGISGLGDTMFYTALSFTVLATTHSLLGLSTILVAQALPRVVLGSLAGVLVDRWDRRLITMMSDLARALVVAAVLLVNIAHQVVMVDAIVMVEAAFSQIFGPAQASLLPELVGNPDHLQRANSWMQTGSLAGTVLGPVAGTFLLVKLGIHATVLPDVISYLVSAGLMGMVLRAGGRPAEAEASGATPAMRHLWHQWNEGMMYILRARWLWAMLAALMLVLLADGALSPGMVAFVYRVLRRNAVDYGLLQSVAAVASIAGGLGVAALGPRVTPERLLVGALGIVGLAYGALFLWGAGLGALVILYGLASLFNAPWITSLSTIMQRRVPTNLQGRIFGSLGSLQSLAVLAGIAVMGLVSPRVGVRPSLVATASLIVLAAAVAAYAVGVPAYRAKRPDEHADATMSPP